MAITSISPASGVVINHGDSFSFTVDDTYTSMIIKVQTDTALVKAYDSSLGGEQSGYTVEVVDNGATDTFTVTPDSGWDTSPQVIYVVEDESGASTSTTISYLLVGEATYPQGSHPYNQIGDGGDLTVKDGSTTVRADVNIIRFASSGFTVTDDGTGSVLVENDIVGGATDHGALTGLTDDDHTQYYKKAGTGAADALYLTERADHVNTPGTGKAEVWLNSATSPSLPYFTDEAGTDYQIRIGAARFRKLSTNHSPILYYGFSGSSLANSGSYGAAGDLTVSGNDFLMPSQCGDNVYARGAEGTGTATKLQSAVIATPQTGLTGMDLTVQVQMWITGSNAKSSGSREPILELASSTSTESWWRLCFAANVLCVLEAVWTSGGTQSLTTSAPAYVVTGGGQMALLALRFKPNGGNMDVSLWMNGYKIAETTNVAGPAPAAANKYISVGEVVAAQLTDAIPRAYEAMKLTTALTDAQMLAEWNYINGA
jgi:hypothetical protein